MDYLNKHYNTMRVERKDDGIAVVRFDRPEAMNAANVEMSLERVEIYAGLAYDPLVRVVIITGSEKAYCAGEIWLPSPNLIPLLPRNSPCGG